MTAEIICVGTELLLGDIVNTNAQFLSRELAELGISVLHQHVIGDNPGRLRDLVKEAKSRSDLLVFSGGLGPTEDDLTKETVAEAFGDTLHFDEAEWQKIVDFGPCVSGRLQCRYRLCTEARYHGPHARGGAAVQHAARAGDGAPPGAGPAAAGLHGLPGGGAGPSDAERHACAGRIAPACSIPEPPEPA